jgi:membrane protein YdbS with pleckstrin-like domain
MSDNAAKLKPTHYDTPLATYHPRFVLWASFLVQLPLQLFFAFWAAVFFGGLIDSFLPTAANLFALRPTLLVGYSVLLVFPLCILIAKNLNYANTTYRVYRDRIEIEQGFFTLHQKEVNLSSVREINLRRGILQRLVGLGSVYIATTATGQGTWLQASAILGGTSTFGSGAMLMDLPKADVAYKQLTGLIDDINTRRSVNPNGL